MVVGPQGPSRVGQRQIKVESPLGRMFGGSFYVGGVASCVAPVRFHIAALTRSKQTRSHSYRKLW